MYASYENWSQNIWPSMWNDISKTMLQPGLLAYFSESVRATEWNDHLLVPLLIFGNLDVIDTQEYEAAMQLVLQFLDSFVEQALCGDKGATQCLVEDIHCCTRDCQHALILAQLFAALYKTFSKSVKAAEFVYHRYRAYLIKAIQYSESYDFMFVGAGSVSSALDRLVVPLDLQGHESTFYDIIDSVAIGIMAERRLLQKQDTIPDGWTEKFAFWHSLYLNKHLYRFDLVVCFLVDSIHQMGSPSSVNAGAQHFVQNYCINVEGAPFFVHDWLIAPVFPYFAMALRAGMSESITRDMHIPLPFCADIMRCIILRGYGYMSQAICAEFAIEIGPLVLPSNGIIQSLNEFGVSINLIKRVNPFCDAYRIYLHFVRGDTAPTAKEIASFVQTLGHETHPAPPIETKRVIETRAGQTVTRILWASTVTGGISKYCAHRLRADGDG